MQITMTETMSEENQNASFQDQVKDAADKAGKDVNAAADAIIEGAGKVTDKLREYKELSPEEKKAKQEEWNQRVTKAAEKASDALKEGFEEIKEKVFGKKESE